LKKYTVAVAGVTGAVGQEILRVLEEQKFPVGRLIPLASKRSVGKTVTYKGEEIEVVELTHEVFAQEGIEIALFSAGGSISAEFAPSAAKAGAVVIDNTSYYRMDEDVPLVVPEVNPEDIAGWKKKGIIANRNCSTIQMMIALKPLDVAFNIERIDVATYQATSGAGASAMQELLDQMRGIFDFSFEKMKPENFPHKIAVNALPHIDKFQDNGFTKEEIKMINESQKIFHKEMQVAATCVRIPVLRGHSEAITIRCKKPINAEAARKALTGAKGVVLMEDNENNNYPTPLAATDSDEVFVGRIRSDLYDGNLLHLWVVADNLRVGAATNAVRIAQKWIEQEG
jgi:aspartate-semialdehyde dehydrogenase